ITPAGRNGFLDNVPIPWTSKVDVTEICQTGRVKVRVECRLPMCGTDGKDENNDLPH
ncbi:hypothetical protein HJV71_21420, partial [Eubacterium callanderi]|nr:hypothetical protein [Eubacterium callanderi]